MVLPHLVRPTLVAPLFLPTAVTVCEYVNSWISSNALILDIVCTDEGDSCHGRLFRLLHCASADHQYHWIIQSWRLLAVLLLSILLLPVLLVGKCLDCISERSHLLRLRWITGLIVENDDSSRGTLHWNSTITKFGVRRSANEIFSLASRSCLSCRSA